MPPIFTGCLRKGVESPKVASAREVSDLSGPAQPVEPFQQRKQEQTTNPVDASKDTLHLEETLVLVCQQLQDQKQMDEWTELLEQCEALRKIGAENDAIAARPTPRMIMPDGTPYSPPPQHHRRLGPAGAYSRKRASYMPGPHCYPPLEYYPRLPSHVLHGLAHQAAAQNVRYPPLHLPAVYHTDGIWQPLAELCIC